MLLLLLVSPSETCHLCRAHRQLQLEPGRTGSLSQVLLSVLQAGGVQRRPLRSDGAAGTGNGAGEEEAAHAGDQTAQLGAGARGRREPQPAPGEGDGGLLLHAGRPGSGIQD